MLYNDETKTQLQYATLRNKVGQYKDDFHHWEEFDEEDYLLTRINLKEYFFEKHFTRIITYIILLFCLIFGLYSQSFIAIIPAFTMIFVEFIVSWKKKTEHLDKISIMIRKRDQHLFIAEFKTNLINDGIPLNEIESFFIMESVLRHYDGSQELFPNGDPQYGFNLGIKLKPKQIRRPSLGDGFFLLSLTLPHGLTRYSPDKTCKIVLFLRICSEPT